MSDLRVALRRLRRTPVFTLFGILTLALGIGGATGVFSIVRAATGPVPGVPNIHRIVNVSSGKRLSLPDYEDVRASQRVFDIMSASAMFRASYAADGHSGTAFSEIVSGEYFSVLGVTPARGRLLQPSDDTPSAPLVVVLGYATWQREFGGADDIVGHVVKINGQSFEVVGVAPPEFHGVLNDGLQLTALWVPLSSAGRVLYIAPGRIVDTHDRERGWLMWKGVLKSNASAEQARADVTGIAKRLDATAPIGRDFDPRNPARTLPRMWTVVPMADDRLDSGTDRIVNAVVLLILAAIGVVLLVVCTNLANLALARGTERRAEYAVRSALGAGRGRLIREAVVESGIVAAAGGLLGLAVARVIAVWLSGDLVVNGAPATLHLDVHLDAVALGVCVVATGLALAVAGLLPALQSTRPDLRAALTSDASQGAVPRWRGRRVLIAGQVCVSVVLLGLAALCVIQLRALQKDPGFALNNLGVAQVDFASQGYDEVRTTRVVEAFLRQMPAHGDAAAVTVASGLPMGILGGGVFLSGSDLPAPLYVSGVLGGVDLLKTLGVPVIRGRAWDARDPAGARVMVVSELLAKTVFHTADVVGRSLSIQNSGDNQPTESYEIIGVAANIDTGSRGQRDREVVYLPFHGSYGNRILFLARAERDADALASDIRDTLRAIDRDLALTLSGTGPNVIGSPMQFFQFSARFATLLGTFAWVLALAGLYGLLSHLVIRRTREIGVRVALGATRADIIAMVIRQGLRPVVLGGAIGLLLTVLANIAFASFLRLSLPIADKIGLAAAPLLFAAAAVLACYLPARRAASVDPNVALRQS